MTMRTLFFLSKLNFDLHNSFYVCMVEIIQTLSHHLSWILYVLSQLMHVKGGIFQRSDVLAVECCTSLLPFYACSYNNNVS